MKFIEDSVIADGISSLISQQLLLICEATQTKQDELSTMIAYQIFDIIDWARMHFNEQAVNEIILKIRDIIPANLLQQCDLEHIEKYAEDTIVTCQNA